MSGNDQYTISLLYGNGADGSTTIIDSANGGARIWTARGTAQIDTAQSVFGGSSILFDGNSDWIDTPSNSNLDLAGGSFTIDFRVRFAAVPASGEIQMLVTRYPDAAHYWDFFLYNVSGTLQWWFNSYGGSATISIAKNAATINANTWYHVALVRTGNTWRIFQDGVQCGTDVTDTHTVGGVGGIFYIGKFGTSANPYYLNGWIDEFRVSSGIARWTDSSFTPPSAAYTTIAEDEPGFTSFWTSIGSHFNNDTSVYVSSPNAARCKTFSADEPILDDYSGGSSNVRGISKDVSWGGIKVTGEFRTDTVASSTCQTGCFYPLISNGNEVFALAFGRGGHFTYNQTRGGASQSYFPNDKTYVANTWYTWEIIFDFVNSTQKTKVDGVDLGDITLKDGLGNTLNGTHTVTKFRFVGSSDGPAAMQFYMDNIDVYSYPDDIQLFNSYLEITNYSLTIENLSHGNSFGSIGLTQVHNLTVANVAHANTIENVAIIQIHHLLVDSLLHGNLISAPSLILNFLLAVQSLSHSVEIGGNIHIFQNHVLTVEGLSHANTIDNVNILFHVGSLIIQDLLHGHSIGNVRLQGFFARLGIDYNFVKEMIGSEHFDQDGDFIPYDFCGDIRNPSRITKSSSGNFRGELM